MKNYIVFMLIGLFFNSCKQDVAVDYPPFEEKLVIESYIVQNDSSFIVRIDKTIDPVDDHYWKTQDTSFEGAQVVLSFNGNSYTTRRISHAEHNGYKINNYTLGRYFVLDKKIENISTVTLSAEYKGKIVESECSLLPVPHVDNALLSGTSTDAQNYTGLKLEIEAAFPAGTSYYKIRIVQAEKVVVIDSLHTWIYPGGVTFGYFTSGNNDRKKQFHFSNVSFPIDSSQRKCSVILSRIEKSYYDFALASKAQIGETDTFLPIETTEVPGNIRGGYGIFTGMCTDTMKVELH